MFLSGVQLVLRSSILAVFLSQSDGCHIEACQELKAGALWGRWICWWWLAVLLRCSSGTSLTQLPPATSKIPPPDCCLPTCFCGDGSNQYYSIWMAGGKFVFVPLDSNFNSMNFRNMEICIASRSLLPKSTETKHDSEVWIASNGFYDHTSC
jgi:hypothetical protein